MVRYKFQVRDYALDKLGELTNLLDTLGELIENNLSGWRKFVCKLFLLKARLQVECMIQKRLRGDPFRALHLWLLKKRIYLIKQIANNEEITEIYYRIIQVQQEIYEFLFP